MLIAVAALVVIMAIIFVIKKFVGKPTVDAVTALIEFVRQQLIALGVTTENSNFDNILEYGVKGLVYIATSCDPDMLPAKQAELGIIYIKGIVGKAGITLTDSDYAILTTILTTGLSFIKSLNIKKEDGKKICKKVGVTYIKK